MRLQTDTHEGCLGREERHQAPEEHEPPFARSNTRGPRQASRARCGPDWHQLRAPRGIRAPAGEQGALWTAPSPHDYAPTPTATSHVHACRYGSCSSSRGSATTTRSTSSRSTRSSSHPSRLRTVASVSPAPAAAARSRAVGPGAGQACER